MSNSLEDSFTLQLNHPEFPTLNGQDIPCTFSATVNENSQGWPTSIEYNAYAELPGEPVNLGEDAEDDSITSHQHGTLGQCVAELALVHAELIPATDPDWKQRFSCLYGPTITVFATRSDGSNCCLWTSEELYVD